MTDEKFRIPINLHFFDEGEKTEQPTEKKKGKARDEGQVAKSQELSTAFLFIFCFFTLRQAGGSMYSRMMSVFHYNFTQIGDMTRTFDMTYASGLINHMFIQALLTAMPMLLVALIVGLATNLVQVKWHVTMKPLMPKFSKLNPISGFKRLFKPTILIELAKSMVKIAIILFVVYSMFKDEVANIPSMVNMEVIPSMMYVGNLMVDLGLTVGMYYLFIAAADIFYVRYKHNKDLKMTKQEVKEEYKQAEGDPKVKGKIRQKMREISMRRMMQSVPKADVIITNPTHYAVALKYDRETAAAPIVVAKGVDYVAKKIKEVAAENNIEIVEDRQLARTLYAVVDIGREIPPDLYQAVAEILAFVYKLKNKVGQAV